MRPRMVRDGHALTAGTRPLDGRQVLVTRARGQADALVGLLRTAGAVAVEFPVIEIAPAEDYAGLDAALRAPERYAWLVLTSVNAVVQLDGRLRELGRDWASLSALQVAVVGPQVARTLQGRGVTVTYMPDAYVGAALARGLPLMMGQRVLLPQADLADPALAARLRARGAEVDTFVVYRTTLPRATGGDLRAMLAGGALDAVTFTSASTARNLCLLVGDDAPAVLDGAVVACIGPVTANEARAVGLWPAVVAAEHTAEGLVRALEEYFQPMSTAETQESPAGPERADSNTESATTTSATLATSTSRRLFAEAQQVIPGGVDSPVRAFKAVGGTPRFVERGEGPYLYDADGNRYIDYVMSYGPLIAGHAPGKVVEAIRAAAVHGTSYGAPTRLETELAGRVCRAMPSIELVRFVSSGTEATMSALRLARAFTGRDVIVKAEGGYHGHSDGLLARAGSAATTLGVPDSPGVPAAIAATTVNVPFNSLGALEEALRTFEVAAFIVEPIPANMGVVLPAPGYLRGVRELTRRYGALLIFDEVITGFRVAYGGAQELLGVTPDLTCLGKIIGGGLPVGAYGGRRDVMSLVAPLGPVYQAGTLSGNPLAMTAGITTLDLLAAPGVYARLESVSATLHEGLLEAARRHGVPAHGTRVGSLGTLFFAEEPVTDYASARASDTVAYARFFHGMLERGVYLAPAQYEAVFVSLAHGDADIATTVHAADEVFEAFTSL